MLKHYTVGIITTIIRKSLLSELNSPFNSKYNIIGDFDLIIKLSLNNKFACIQAPLAYYRIHQTNYSSINYESEIEELEDWLKNQVIFDKSKFIWIEYSPGVIENKGTNSLLIVKLTFLSNCIGKKSTV